VWSTAETWNPIIHFTPQMKTTKVFTTQTFGHSRPSLIMQNNYLRNGHRVYPQNLSPNPLSWVSAQIIATSQRPSLQMTTRTHSIEARVNTI
jgi:hypothetical protein